MVFKTGKDKIAKQASAVKQTLYDMPAVDIDGNEIPRLGALIEGKKCIMVINVASK